MKRALLVGIDDYPGTASDLKSCCNDVAQWKALLMERFGFKRENIRLLTNNRATIDEVRLRLEWLKTGNEPGDQIVFFYSGHGTTFTNRDRVSGEVDEAKDEALCLYGYRFRDMLVDDELQQVFSTVPPEVNITTICDSCFSGGMDKAFEEDIEVNYEITGTAKFKYLATPVDIAHRSDPFSPVRIFGCGLSKNQGLKAAKSHDQSESTSMLLGACRETEMAAADRPETEGLSVFSYYTIRAIRSSATTLTAQQLIERVAQDISNAGYPQIPQLKGKEDLFDRPFLGEFENKSTARPKAKRKPKKSVRKKG